MSFADAVAFSALVIGIISVSGIWLDGYKTKARNRLQEMELKVRLAEADRSAGGQRIGEVEERLRVLERIATDPTHRLSHEIESLRASSADREPVQ